MKLQFETRGGIAYMYAVPPKSLIRIRRNFGDDDTFTPEFTNREEIIQIPVYAGAEYSFTEQKSRNEDGESYDCELSGKIPAHLIERKTLNSLANGLWLVIHQNKMGKIILSGTTEIPLKFDYTENSGSSDSELNGHSFSFSGEEMIPSMECAMIDITNL